ncbi:putative chaperone protein EcpD [Serratia fonticola]|uniref:Putative chaperone protein EcpD n=1 Tax=Serratia fonticola TaxID=47917 RepID=A0A4U9UW45_SERFO|nr:putative chaperone protein EcpD [Serratia fonticola]
MLNPNPDTVKVPFTPDATGRPYRSRVKGQALRIARTGGGLPSNRESLFWLNVLEIPPKASQKIAAGDKPDAVLFPHPHQTVLSAG